jgi:hypothetical protein
MVVVDQDLLPCLHLRLRLRDLRELLHDLLKTFRTFQGIWLELLGTFFVLLVTYPAL